MTLAFAFTLAAHGASAQPAVSGGVAVPITLSTNENGDIGTGLWAEATAPISARVGVHVGFDWATPYEVEFQPSTRVTGSGTYQETVLSTGVGIRLSAAPRSELTAVGAFGLVFARADETVRIASGGVGPAETQRTRATRLASSVTGGLNVTTAANDRIGFVFRIRVRLTDRGSVSSRATFSALTLVPSVGVRFVIR